MFVKDRMSHPVITVTPDVSIVDALDIMRRERIRRMPVVDKRGRLVGIVTEKDILNASPSSATSLSVWEINYLISKITVGEVMTKDVITVDEDTCLEEAARIMADNKIGGLPVMRGDKVVGIITESDLFKVFLELMGARVPGVRLTVLVPDVPGELAKLAQAVAGVGGNIISLSTFEGDDPSNRYIVMKIRDADADALREAVKPLVEKVVDLRVMRPA
ncbi:MAG: CBS domain-containing protein [Chloroflexi bacterium]|nr:CBS domain-containing protein [Chloroflexota bacterium]